MTSEIAFGIAPCLPESADALANAAALYQRIGEMTGSVIHEGAIFPAFYQPDALDRWTDDVRKKEIDLLGSVGDLDRKAIAFLKRAL